MVNTKYLGIIGGIILVALGMFFIPIQQGSAITLVDQALCTIFTPNNGGNATCTIPDDTFDFIGVGGIIINASGPKEITFTVDANGTITNCTNIGSGEDLCVGTTIDDLVFKTLVAGTDINLTSTASTVEIGYIGPLAGAGNVTGGFSLGGDADVFKNQVGSILNFRGISGAGDLEVTERTGDILLNVTAASTLGELTDVVDGACPSNGEIIAKNNTSGEWECTDPSEFIASSGGANSKEMLRGHIARGTGGEDNHNYVDYEHRMFEYAGNADNELSWAFAVSNEYDGTNDITVRIYWTQDNGGGGTAGDVCFTGQFAPVSIGDDISDISAIGTTAKTVCKTGPLNDILEITTLTFTPAEHGIANDEMVLFQLTRPAISNGLDTLNDPIIGYGAVVGW